MVNAIKKNPLLLTCLALTALTMIPFMGCGGGTGGGSTNNQSSAPNIFVNKTQIAFGDVVVDGSSQETISIQNTGSSELIIGQIAAANGLSLPFSLLDDTCSQKSLAPSTACTLKVRFSPASQGEFPDTFDIPSNDPADNVVTVSVSGYGLLLNASINEFFTDSCPDRGTLLVTVTDKEGNPLTGLTKDLFSVSENGVTKAIANLSQATDTSPISVALLLDYSYSMSMGTQISDMETAAKTFINQLDPVKGDEGAVIKYATEIILIDPPAFTTNKDALITAVDTPYVGGNDTHLYDAAWFATQETAARPNRRAVIIVSDGDDFGSIYYNLDEVIANAKSKGVPLFMIGIGTVNQTVLERMANETGGRYFYAPTSADLTAIYLQVAEILAGQYIIEYDSPSAGPGTVIVGLEVKDLSNALGRAFQTLEGCP